MSFRSLTPKNGGIPWPSFRLRAYAALACPDFCPAYFPGSPKADSPLRKQPNLWTFGPICHGRLTLFQWVSLNAPDENSWFGSIRIRIRDLAQQGPVPLVMAGRV